MVPVDQFKFACPVCGQHLQARSEEAGQTTECPSCFKKLTVPQAPTQAGGKLLIAAALADTRRGPARKQPEADSHTARRFSTSSPSIYVLLTVLIGAVVATGILYLSLNGGSSGRTGRPELWTDNAAELKLLEDPVFGRLNGWDFSATSMIWKDTRLILRQDERQPGALRLQITFPLQGGELVSGKTFRLARGDAPFETPPRILWRDEAGRDHHEPVASGYVLWVRFDEVSPSTVSGRIHICLPDTARSWAAGSFSAENRTQLK